MKTALAVAAGGAAGASARYALTLALAPAGAETGALPLATFAANVSGSFMLGVLLGAASIRQLPVRWKEGLATGLLGGYTTFSAFGIDTLLLLQDGRLGVAAGYAAASIVFGYAAAQAGYAAGRRAAAAAASCKAGSG